MSRSWQRRCLIIPSYIHPIYVPPQVYLLFSDHVQLTFLSTNDSQKLSMVLSHPVCVCSLIKRMMIRPCLYNLLRQTGKLEKFLHGNGVVWSSNKKKFIFFESWPMRGKWILPVNYVSPPGIPSLICLLMSA